MIVYGDERRKLAECYTIAGAQRPEAMNRRKTIGSRERRILERNMTTLSATVESEDDGRSVLPPKVREVLGVAALAGGQAVRAARG